MLSWCMDTQLQIIHTITAFEMPSSRSTMLPTDTYSSAFTFEQTANFQLKTFQVAESDTH